MLDEIDNFEEDEEDPTLVHSFGKHKIILFVLSVCISFGLVYNLKSEAQSLKRGGFINYINNPWNILDIVSSFMNVLFMVTLNINVIRETNQDFSKF